MYWLRGIPFPDAISFVGHFCQRLTPIYNVFKKYYFVDSNSDDYGILFQRKMFMGSELIRYILAAIASRALNILNTTHQCTQPLNTAHNCTQPTFFNFHNNFIILTGTGVSKHWLQMCCKKSCYAKMYITLLKLTVACNNT